MKTIKIIIALIFGMLYYSFSEAQTVKQRIIAEGQTEIKNCPYVIEGIITQQKRYNGKSGRMICSVVQITKIFRGSPQLKLGTIKIISQDNKGVEDAGPNLGRGHYIIFGTLASLSDTLYKTENSLTLKCTDWITFTGTGAVWGWRYPTTYKTTDSLYSFFNENGLTEEEEQSQQPVMPKDTIK